MKEEVERLEKKIVFLQESLRREKKMDQEEAEHDRIHQAATDAANQIEREKEQEQEELDATERPVAQARVEGETTAEYRRLAYQYEEQAKWGKALEYYNKAIEAYPEVTGPLAESDLHTLKEKSKGIANFIKAERGVSK